MQDLRCYFPLFLGAMHFIGTVIVKYKTIETFAYAQDALKKEKEKLVFIYEKYLP